MGDADGAKDARDAGGGGAPLTRTAHGRPLGREAAWLGGFVLLTLVLTWPMVAELSRPASLRGDTYNNLWNVWWMRVSLLEAQISPWWTDYLHTPVGISLARHTLSPFNALLGALMSYGVGIPAAFNLLVIGNFAFAAWAAFLLARDVSGSEGGALLAGLLYSFSPYHYAYLAQINVSSLGFLPLTLLFLLRVRREGGTGNVVGVALSAGLLAATAQYYLVYAALIGGLMLLAGSWLQPRVERRDAAARMLPAAIAAAVAVALIAWPMIVASLGELAAPVVPADAGNPQAHRTNDLLGYNWLGPPELYRVSWPTMLGYSTLTILLLGWRGVRRQRFWLALSALFALLGLGASLRVAGVDTGIPLPYALLDLPVLSMLRKADRCQAVVQLGTAVLLACAWRELAPRLGGTRQRTAALALCTAVLAIELSAAPFETYEVALPAYYTEIAADPEVQRVVHLPPGPSVYFAGRYDWAQTAHGKKMPQGYTTPLALTPELRARESELRQAHMALEVGDVRPLAILISERGIDLVIVHKQAPVARLPIESETRTIWAPFRFEREALVRSRQLGPILEQPVSAEILQRERAALTEAFGAPVHEDDEILVFRST